MPGLPPRTPTRRRCLLDLRQGQWPLEPLIWVGGGGGPTVTSPPPFWPSSSTHPMDRFRRASPFDRGPGDSVPWWALSRAWPLSHPSGGVLAAVADFNVGDLHVFLAVRPARLRRHVAEVELSGARLTDRPATGDHPSIRSGRRGNRPRRWDGDCARHCPRYGRRGNDGSGHHGRPRRR